MWIWFVLASAILNILGSLIMKTENTRSFIAFKALPFFAGLGTLLFFLIYMKLI